MAYRTLGELRAELLSRLGMGGMGASGGANQTIMDSFLRDAQKQLYWMQDWRHLTWYFDKTLGVSQNLIDYPDECEDDRRVLRLEVPYSGEYRKLIEGIETGDWSTMDTEATPAKYERFAQLLIYPKADQIYTVRVWYVKDLHPFTQDNHPATLDDGMVFLFALANAKAHYRQPDAQTYQAQLNSLLASIRGQSFGRNGVYRRGDNEPVERRPAVLGRDA